MKPPTRHIIEDKLLNELVNYLAHRPYAEVFRMIAALGRLEEAGGCNNGRCNNGGELAPPRQEDKKAQ